MRKAMQDCVRNIIEDYNDSSLMLVDIGVWPFRDLLEKYPQRVKNIGIFESGTISIAAGLSLLGITPFVYGISPFIVQRSLEQLKLDFVYQKLNGNFITTGASYDFSTLGYSHYCPEDVAILRTLPGMEVICPGTPQQFRTLFAHTWNDGNPTYYRMTDYCNVYDTKVEFGKAEILRRGKQATVIAVAETLDIVMEACEGYDITIVYYTTLCPFDYDTLRMECHNERVVAVHPFYEGTLTPDIIKALGCIECLEEVCTPLEVIRSYGTKQEKDNKFGITADGVKQALRRAGVH